MELVFEDVSTFDAENPIVGSLLRETDLNKKQTDNDFIKSLPSQPGKEFEIQKRLDTLNGIKRYGKKNNNNNDNNSGNLFSPPPPGPGGDNDLFPPRPGTGQGPGLPPPPNNSPNFHVPAQTSSFNRSSGLSALPPANNFFSSQTATMTREKLKDGNLIKQKLILMTLFTNYQKIVNLS